LVEDDRRFQAVCLEELVSGHLTDRSVLSERAAAFGWDLSLPRAVLLAQVELSSVGDPDTVRSLADAARAALGASAIVWERSTQAAALLAPRGADPATLEDAAVAMRREAARRMPSAPVTIGVGRIRDDPLELRESHAEARRALGERSSLYCPKPFKDGPERPPRSDRMLDVANGHTTRHRPTAGGVVVSWPDPTGAPTGWPHRHLLDVDQLTRDELETCLD